MQYMDFEDLPAREIAYLIDVFGLSDFETRILTLRYVMRLSYAEIAATMHLSEKSVGGLLSRARRHMFEIANNLYDLQDERARKLIDVLGWRELDWPVIRNRNRKRALEGPRAR